MKIGIISDTHDNLENLTKAIQVLRAEGVTKVFHCGDVCGIDVIRALRGFEVWIAQGNMDRHSGTTPAIEKIVGPERMRWLQKPTLNGYAIAMLHGDNEEMLMDLIRSEHFAYVFHGHTHRRCDQTIGRTRVINPGALGGTRRQSRSLCILDLATGKARFIEV